MMSSGLKVPIPAIPTPDLAVPMAAPAELRIMAAAQLHKKRKEVEVLVGASNTREMVVDNWNVNIPSKPKEGRKSRRVLRRQF